MAAAADLKKPPVAGAGAGAVGTLNPVQRATRRLMHDLREIEREPIMGVSAQPLENDLFNWHANLTPPDGPYHGVVFHVELTFSKDYPSVPPSQALLRFVMPHPNVFPGWFPDGNAYICLDLFKVISTTVPYTGWSSAYTVNSILMQLLSFLFDAKVPQEYGGLRENRAEQKEIDACIKYVREFKCEKCPHTHDKPFPPIAVPPPAKATIAHNTDEKVAADSKESRSTRGDSRPIQTAPGARLRVRRKTSGGGSGGGVKEIVKCGGGRFGGLGSDVLHWVFRFLLADEVRGVVRTCRLFADVVRGHRILERQRLTCFHRKVSFEEPGEVLGFGVKPNYYLNTKDTGTRAIENIECCLDLVSYDAFEHDRLRLGVWKEPFSHFLPVLINERHASRAFPLLDRLILQIANRQPHIPQTTNPLTKGTPSPETAPAGEMVMQVVGHLMNSLVVAFMRTASDYKASDGGVCVHASERALIGYCALHHLLLGYAMRADYPKFVEQAQAAVRRVIAKPESRTKKEMANLGAWLPTLLVAGIPWSQVAEPIIGESLSRNVKWQLDKNPELCRGLDLPVTGAAICYRLHHSFANGATGLRLLMFQTWFLRLAQTLSEGGIADMWRRYNRWLGQPNGKMVSALQAACRAIMRVRSYEDAFEILGLGRVKPHHVYLRLIGAVRASEAIGYHRPYLHRRTEPPSTICVCSKFTKPGDPPLPKDRLGRTICRYSPQPVASQNAQQPQQSVSKPSSAQQSAQQSAPAMLAKLQQRAVTNLPPPPRPPPNTAAPLRTPPAITHPPPNTAAPLHPPSTTLRTPPLLAPSATLQIAPGATSQPPPPTLQSAHMPTMLQTERPTTLRTTGAEMGGKNGRDGTGGGHLIRVQSLAVPQEGSDRWLVRAVPLDEKQYPTLSAKTLALHAQLERQTRKLPQQPTPKPPALQASRVQPPEETAPGSAQDAKQAADAEKKVVPPPPKKSPWKPLPPPPPRIPATEKDNHEDNREDNREESVGGEKGGRRWRSGRFVPGEWPRPNQRSRPSRGGIAPKPAPAPRQRTKPVRVNLSDGWTHIASR